MAAAQPIAMLGKYELLRRIGQGGMAEVFLARTRSIGGFERLVVIKRLLEQWASDPSIVRMFLDEARIAAQLHHVNIAQVHDVDSADGAVFYAMEYLRGHDLTKVMDRMSAQGRRFPLDQAIAIGLGTCVGLDHAHQLRGPDGELLNLVHRDVSPHNVIVLFDGTVKLIDFGIAKVTGTRPETQAGFVRGKFCYMSPEQALGQPLDARSDLFALAIVLYELTTGRRLFALREYDALRAIVYSDAIPPSRFDRSFPPELERIVLRGLARDRTARYPTALALQNDLEAFARARDLDISTLALSRFMAEAFAEDAAELTRPVLETLREDTGTWALGSDPVSEPAPADERTTSPSDFVMTAPQRPSNKTPPPAEVAGPVTATVQAPSERPRASRRAPLLGAGALVMLACVTGVWWWSGNSAAPAATPMRTAPPIVMPTITVDAAESPPPIPAAPPEPVLPALAPVAPPPIHTVHKRTSKPKVPVQPEPTGSGGSNRKPLDPDDLLSR